MYFTYSDLFTKKYPSYGGRTGKELKMKKCFVRVVCWYTHILKDKYEEFMSKNHLISDDFLKT